MARPAPARTLKKQVFAWRVCQFSHLALVRARPKNTADGMKTSTANSQNAQRTAHAERSRQTFKIHHFWELQALRNRPQGSPKRPRKRLEAAGSQSQRQFAAKNIPGTPAKPSESLRRAMRVSQEAPSNRFCSPRPPGDGQLSKKSNITTTPPGI